MSPRFLKLRRSQTYPGNRANLDNSAFRLDKQWQEMLAHHNDGEKVSLEGLANFGELYFHSWHGVICINQHLAQVISPQCNPASLHTPTTILC
jgi:hypothetical protein